MLKKIFVMAIFLCYYCVDASKIEHDRGCRYINGRCVEECPVGTRSYSPSCFEPAMTERTCTEPIAKFESPVCDLSRCDCDKPTVKDEKTGKCVKTEDCSKPEGPYHYGPY